MPKQIYLDTSTIIAYLNKERDRGHILLSALDQAQNHPNQVRFYASVATVLELTHLMEEQKVRPDSLLTIDLFWDSALITVVEINDTSARLCCSLMRFRSLGVGRNVTPQNKAYTIDAIHLAVARWLKCDELWTYNPTDFARFNEPPEISISEPSVQQLVLEGM